VEVRGVWRRPSTNTGIGVAVGYELRHFQGKVSKLVVGTTTAYSEVMFDPDGYIPAKSYKTTHVIPFKVNSENVVAAFVASHSWRVGNSVWLGIHAEFAHFFEYAEHRHAYLITSKPYAPYYAKYDSARFIPDSSRLAFGVQLAFR
jgi:hypothetical protein